VGIHSAILHANLAQGTVMAIQTEKSWRKGFSLVELMVALVVLGILASRAVPAFRNLVEDLRLHGAATGFERVIRHARREAVSRRSTARICPSADGDACQPGAHWEDGWISYLDILGGPDRDAGDPLLRVFGPRRHLRVHFNGGSRISINSLGRISRNGSMDFCGSGNRHPGLRLVMVHSGRLRLTSPSPRCDSL
jgi:prepilin-type N-terminal cleavage/methylation domain-containing protein